MLFGPSFDEMMKAINEMLDKGTEAAKAGLLFRIEQSEHEGARGICEGGKSTTTSLVIRPWTNEGTEDKFC